MEFSIDCCLPCAFSFDVVSSLTSLFDLRPDFLGFSGGSSPSSTSCCVVILRGVLHLLVAPLLVCLPWKAHLRLTLLLFCL
jgi:hypothetical protein